MLTAVGENDERSFEVLGVATGLFLGIIRVEAFALCFEHTQHATKAVFEQVVRPTVRRMQLKLDLLGVQQIPPTELQGFID